MSKKLIISLIILAIFLFGCAETRDNIKATGVGVKDSEGIQKTSFSSSILLGKYHSATSSGNSPADVYETRTFNLKDYPLGDNFNSNDYATNIGEPKEQSKSEMAIAIFNVFDIYSGGTVNMKWYSDYDDALMFSKDYAIPDPKTKGYTYWKWYTVYTWIGHFPKGTSSQYPHEINKEGTYRVVITTSWKNAEIAFTVNGCSTNSDCNTNNCQSGVCVQTITECTADSDCTELFGIPESGCCDQSNGKCYGEGYYTLLCSSGKCKTVSTPCNNDEACQNGYCTKSCVPDCINKNCGDNGCGGSCGGCSTNEECRANNCEAVIEPEPDQTPPKETQPQNNTQPPPPSPQDPTEPKINNTILIIVIIVLIVIGFAAYFLIYEKTKKK